MFEIELLEKIHSILKETTIEEVSKKLKETKLPAPRIDLVENILSGRQKIGLFEKIDTLLYVAKIIDPQKHRLLNAKSHANSNGQLYEYDPTKNGQNIIKHGISFTEAASYSRHFGTLIVPCPEENHERRAVILSDLSLDKFTKLSLPLDSTLDKEKLYTISVAQQLEGKFRFISARVISDKNIYKKMRNAQGNIP